MSGTVVQLEKWPVFARHERAAGWLQVWIDLGRAPRTIDAYARGLAEYLEMCERDCIDPLAAARTNTFLGERYRRIVKRRGKLKALVAVARSILVIIWHLLTDPTGRYRDLGTGYYANHIDKNRKTRNHIRQLEALGFTVTLAPAA